MATKKKVKRGRPKGSKGPTTAARIARLEKELPAKAVKLANQIAKDTPNQILTLAYLKARKPTTATGVRGLADKINELSAEKQEKARELIAAIKAL